jgi:small subunit ribosomal protein S20
MAHHKSAIKRIKISEKQRERNRVYKSRLKTALKRVKDAKDKEAATAALTSAYSIIDKLVAKGILPKNTAANKKSRLTRYVHSMN